MNAQSYISYNKIVITVYVYECTEFYISYNKIVITVYVYECTEFIYLIIK